MSKSTKEWKLEYPIPPGLVLQEHLAARNYSQAEFARRCGRSPKLISEIIAGKAPLEAKTALQFERVLGLNASIWINIESEYRLFLVREMETNKIEWTKTFPVRELVKRGCFSKPESDADCASKLLTFFGVASPDAWKAHYSNANVAYRHSPSFQSDEKVLATWLRLGAIEAEQQNCVPYSKNQFMEVAQSIRNLTRKPFDIALKHAKKLCNEAGVALVLVRPFKRMALSGAAWWLSPRRAVVQLTARHKTSDHFWFSFFHEAAHVLLHSKKAVFIDDQNKSDTEQESEANEWASKILIPKAAWKQITDITSPSAKDVKVFAEEQGIDPGIVVGRLQHEKIVHWDQMNHFKTRLTWDA